MRQAIISHEPVLPGTVNWVLDEVHVKTPADDEVLVEMYASGICHTDLTLSSVPTGALGIAYPKVVGHEGAGIVRAVGKKVDSIELGDPVLLSFYSCSQCQQCMASHPAYCDLFALENYTGRRDSMKVKGNKDFIWSRFFGHSSLAEHSVVSKSSIVNAKHLVKDAGELKLFAPLGCGFQTGMGAIQNITNACQADIVMILGLGAVGMGAVMTARISDCKAIVVVDRVKNRLDLAKKLGASHAIDTSAPGFTTLFEDVKSWFPSGVSIAIDTTGVPSIIEQAIQSTHARGKTVLIGVPPFGYELNIQVAEHINSGRSIMGCIEGDCNPHIAIPQMMKWYREGRFAIDQLVHYFDATEYAQALTSLKEGLVIKPVLVWKKEVFKDG